jgi:phage baseplate assembly protein W
MENFENTFLGRGWAFPPEFNPVSGQTKMLSNEDDIQSSLRVLLATRVGERIMQPSFGCNLDIMLFEPLNTTLKTEIKDLIFTAIYNYEPRIRPLSISLTGKDDEVKATNSRYNLVFPFYINEGA